MKGLCLLFFLNVSGDTFIHGATLIPESRVVKFVFSKKATKIEETFTVEDFVNFCGLLRKHELYQEKEGHRSKASLKFFKPKRARSDVLN